MDVETETTIDYAVVKLISKNLAAGENAETKCETKMYETIIKKFAKRNVLQSKKASKPKRSKKHNHALYMEKLIRKQLEKNFIIEAVSQVYFIRVVQSNKHWYRSAIIN